jgi:hypothetical protein
MREPFAKVLETILSFWQIFNKLFHYAYINMEGWQQYFLRIDEIFAHNILAPSFKRCLWCPVLLLPVLTFYSAAPFTHETWALGATSLLTYS